MENQSIKKNTITFQEFRKYCLEAERTLNELEGYSAKYQVREWKDRYWATNS